MAWKCLGSPGMTRHLRAAVVVGAGLAAYGLGSGVAVAQTQAAGGEVTFTRDILPILQRSCQTCHRPNSLAPMSLLSYEEVRPWARSIMTRTSLDPTEQGVMPPYFVDRTIGIQHFKDDPRLSLEEVDQIRTWVQSGAPRGNPSDAPAPRVFASADEWQIGNPDLIVKTPSVEMKAGAPDWWGDLGSVETGLTEDRYVAAVEVKEVRESGGGAARGTVGGLFIIHHLCYGASGPAGNEDGGREGLPCHEVGRNADIFDPEIPRKLVAGSKLDLRSWHLHASTEDVKSHALIGFKFHPRGFEPPRPVRRRGLFGNSMNLDIKPMEANQMFEAYTVLEDNARVVSWEPHMHAAGVKMCLDAITGTGVHFETLSCVGYDHSWVRTYPFAEHAQPLLPKGTILRLRGYFDNTPANSNVEDPRNWSGNGHRSIDNMMNELGETVYLTDEEFQAELRKRREVLGLKPGQAVVGCPLCGAFGGPPTPTAQN